MSERQRDRATRGVDVAGFPVDPPGPVRPPRPAAVEFASAIMVVTGIMASLATVGAIGSMSAQGGEDPGLALLSLALGVGTTVLGVLVRYGRAWLIAVNVLAVAGFLELISGTGPGFLFGGIDVLVVVILLVQRPWFAWRPDRPGDEGDAG